MVSLLKKPPNLTSLLHLLKDSDTAAWKDKLMLSPKCQKLSLKGLHKKRSNQGTK